FLGKQSYDLNHIPGAIFRVRLRYGEEIFSGRGESGGENRIIPCNTGGNTSVYTRERMRECEFSG
ncbi:MAG: hypothetical protein JSU79_06035, partial [Dehalococcoidales bacterium]